MSRAPHPALRRLYAQGGAPARAAERLAAPLAALDRLAGDLDGLDLLSDRAIAPLVKEIDLAAVFARSSSVQDAEGSTGPAALRAKAPKAPVVTKAPIQQAARPAALTPSPLPCVPPSRPPRTGEGERPAESRGTTAVASEGRRRPSPARGGGEGDARGRGREGAAEGGKDAGLRARAERAGAPTAADRPVGATPDPEVAAILSRAAAAERTAPAAATAEGIAGDAGPRQGRRQSALTPGPSPISHPGPRRERGEPSQNTPSPLSGVRAPFAPDDATFTAAHRPSPAFSPLPGKGGREMGEGPGVRALARALERLDDRRASRPAPPDVPSGGLRRLAALAIASEEPEEAAALDGSAPAALPTAIRERMEEAALGARIERLLRREAERQGIDLSEVAR